MVRNNKNILLLYIYLDKYSNRLFKETLFGNSYKNRSKGILFKIFNQFQLDLIIITAT